MPRKVLREFPPDSATVRAHRLAARFGSPPHQPDLRHLNRCSVAGGFAVGPIAGLVPGRFPMQCAAMQAGWRACVVLAWRARARRRARKAAP